MPRKPTSLRPLYITTDVNLHAEGSCLVSMGETRVMCTASVEKRVPEWMRGKGRGWVTAEYAMLPRATSTRSNRKQNSRALEISRLIGRSLRAAVDLDKMGEVMITVDCDVLQADGGTRTASINGGMVALVLAIHKLREEGVIAANPVISPVGAVSVGIIDGKPALDLDYELDHRAEVDMNIVMNAKGALVEVQGSAEGKPFSRADMETMLDMASAGIKKILVAQKKAVAEGTV
ncbi:MAG: ribonuclease PH [Planctomycetaceae bacterium]|nr:ribonuclease PH [Planctomycetaceae bacterium]